MNSSIVLPVDSLQAQAEQEKRRRAYRADPVLFAERRLGLKIWSRQAEILRAAALYHRVAVRSGHKIGKSMSAAILAIWFIYCFQGARVVMTSSTDRQVRRILWRELRGLWPKVKDYFGVEPALDPDTGIQLADRREIVGFSTKDAEKMAGFSGANMLFLVDEASGVSEEIFEAIEGNRAGGARIVMWSNPTQTSGAFYEAFTSKREFWSHDRGGSLIHVSSEEAVAERIPGLATKYWVDEKRDEWGEESPLYQVRVRGNFPTQAENAVIGLGVVEEALARWRDDEAEEKTELGIGPLELGVDVARFGDDDSVVYPVRGKKALKPTAVHGQDTVQVAGKVLAMARDLRSSPSERVVVKVDVIGVGGGVADQLRQFPKEIELVEVNVAEAATVEGYHKLRDQIWFSLASWLKTGAIPEDGALEAELVAPTYKFDVSGRQQVESKDDIKKRLKRSPDRADALGLAVYKPRKLPPRKAIGAAPPRASFDDTRADFY